jgi:hypothetical protein
MSSSDAERIEQAILEARRLGWSVYVEEESGRWQAWGAPSIPGTGVFARDLPTDTTQAEAEEAGLEAIVGAGGVSRREVAAGATEAEAAEAGLTAIREIVRGSQA